MRPPIASSSRAHLPPAPLGPKNIRCISLLPRSAPPPQPRHRKRPASTVSANTDWMAWLRKASALRVGSGSDEGNGGKALLFAGLGSYPHTPHSPTPSSILVWEQASEALLNPDATIGYFPKRMEEFAGNLRGGRGIRGWMRGWVEGRSLVNLSSDEHVKELMREQDELMSRPDVTAAFILASSVAVLASAQEASGSSTLLPLGTSHLAGHGFIGTLTALVAAGHLDLTAGVRLASMYASLPPSPPSNSRPTKHLTTVLSARLFHSLSSPPWDVPSDDSESSRRRAMQLILDEVHALQKEWQVEGTEWAGAGIINSSKVLVVTGTQHAVLQIIERLQQLSLANPVMDVHMPCPYNTPLMEHALPKFRDILQRCSFRATPGALSTGKEPIILDPVTTHPITSPSTALLAQLTHQLRWHKTLSRLYTPPVPDIGSFLTVGRGAKGLGVMLRAELRKRPEGAAEIAVEEFGVKDALLGARARL